eukprot:TRINITY_DN2122_c0_g1_i1.p1 TRINITY_DN2122_c0_g1~~TRINITY_DN2122_c0_g1_i1.p1  ORF type:complete len:580 (-),score=142.18 TRINITY_DN2122_c0_g1_i1:10-1749(-)
MTLEKVDISIKPITTRPIQLCLISKLVGLEIDSTEKIQTVIFCQQEFIIQIKSNILGSIGFSTEINIVDSSLYTIDKPKTKYINEKAINELKEVLNFCFNENLPENINLPKGILIKGAPGSGKTHLVRSVLHESQYNVIKITSEDFSQIVGMTEKKLKTKFTLAEKMTPSVILFENADLFLKNSDSDLDRKIINIFVNLLDQINGRVVVIGTITESINNQLLSSGRFERTVLLTSPDMDEVEQIIESLCSKYPYAFNIEDVSQLCHGFWGCDVVKLVRHAQLLANGSMLTYEHFKQARRFVIPSALNEVHVEVPCVTWTDIGGYEYVKQMLKEMVEWPLTRKKEMEKFGINAPSGLLLYGPPGCSKTMMAKALATESKFNFIAVKGAEVFSKWVGESERKIREIFTRARAASPCVIFFDEIDALAVSRDSHSTGVGARVLSQLLNEMDGVEESSMIVVVAATNRPDILDSALTRPGRLDRLVYVSLPDKPARKAIFSIKTRKMPLDKNVFIDELSDLTDGYTGAEIQAICQEAALIAMRQSLDIETITLQHFQEALDVVKPAITKKTCEFYEDFRLGKM